jgi:hypothetical protein
VYCTDQILRTDEFTVPAISRAGDTMPCRDAMALWALRNSAKTPEHPPTSCSRIDILHRADKAAGLACESFGARGSL